jgi:hypothetical protein
MLNSALVFARVVSLYPFPYYFVSDWGEGLEFFNETYSRATPVYPKQVRCFALSRVHLFMEVSVLSNS